MAKIARLAGAPMMKKAGVDLLKKLGNPVKKGDTLYRIYAEFPAILNSLRIRPPRTTDMP